MATFYNERCSKMDVPAKVDLAVSAALEQWTDHRIIEDGELYALLMLMVYQYDWFVNSGYSLRGFSFRQRDGRWLLTVKVSESGTPLVVFVTAENPTDCVYRFYSLAFEDRLSWVRDRYA